MSILHQSCLLKHSLSQVGHGSIDLVCLDCCVVQSVIFISFSQIS
ncbi:hypothetical protein NC651_030138 [Populus alba x Populus x berolinensis]|nr:hypothetical protein NC651_030138 [Populus alba x Populus x berolinensis]